VRIFLSLMMVLLLADSGAAQQKTTRPRKANEVVWYIETNLDTETSWVTFDRPVRTERVTMEVERLYFLEAPKWAKGWPEPLRLELWQNSFTVKVLFPCTKEVRTDLGHLPVLGQRVAQMLFPGKKVHYLGIQLTKAAIPKTVMTIRPQHPYRLPMEFTCKRPPEKPEPIE
jgi:hypothetical protein